MLIQTLIKPALAIAAVAVAGSAYADTRSSQAISKPAQASAKSGAQSAPQGPKQGFPDNHGLERAREVANEHARFLRNDSEG